MTLPKIELISVANSPTVVLPCRSVDKDEKKGPPSGIVFLGKKNKDIDALNLKLGESKHFSARNAETSLLRFFPVGTYSNVVLLGLGLEKKMTAESLRQAGAALSALQKKEKLEKLSVSVDSLVDSIKPNEKNYALQAFCEGYLLSGYEFSDLKKKKEDKAPAPVQALQLETTKPASLKSSLELATILSESVCFARGLGDRPGNYLTPSVLAELASQVGKEAKLKVTVMGGSEIQSQKMGLFWGVAKGSVEDPKFIVMEYRGGNKTDRPVALVGKGITFDSGGISLKPAAKMEDMKYDMMGAAAVVGIMRSIGLLKPKINIVAVIPSCENMPDGKAQKPGDVMTSRNGKTVEIINTDAEGRLILADALEYVQSEFEPQAIIDFATLTGAVIDALGTVTSGIMGTNPELIARIKSAASLTGERVWELPLYEEYEEDLKSSVADIKNSGIREAGSSKGGTFLKFFVDQKYPWVHCDIAGTSYHRKDVNYHPTKYGAGVMVRLMTHMLLQWKNLK